MPASQDRTSADGTPGASPVEPAGRLDRVAVAAEPIANRLIYGGVLLLVVAFVPGSPLPVPAAIAVIAAGALLFALGLLLRVAGRPRLRPQEEAIEIAFPLRGRWVSLNGPAERVPSHRTHTHGQSYAIDFVHVPEGVERAGIDWALVPARADAYPAFGEPVHAPLAGTVVRARDGTADGRGRMSWPALVFMMTVEGVARTAFGSDRLVGNHVVLDAGGRRFVVLAHLRRGTVAVREGDRVEVGGHVGDCGSSGNSAEPHLHLHLMDHPRPLVGVGLPWRFVDAVGDDGRPQPLPGDEVAVRPAAEAAARGGAQPRSSTT